MKARILLFATSNTHKLEEFRHILAHTSYEIRGLQDLGITEEIPEDGSTLRENALIKARYLFEKSGIPVLAEDTGLEVDALGGAPGVHTARYAGAHKSAADNMEKLLRALEGKTDRTARFRTVIAYYDGAKPLYFEGVAEGSIATSPSGAGGFGYDPVFIPDGYTVTFAEMDKSLKNTISHRAKAIKAMLLFFNKDT
jgi:XTP/dITP diphosphohydrolase